MKTSGLIGALSTKRARFANVPRPNQPDTGKRHPGVRDKALDDPREDAVYGRLRGDR
jgi:hypothetical protein